MSWINLVIISDYCCNHRWTEMIINYFKLFDFVSKNQLIKAVIRTKGILPDLQLLTQE